MKAGKSCQSLFESFELVNTTVTQITELTWSSWWIHDLCGAYIFYTYWLKKELPKINSLAFVLNFCLILIIFMKIACCMWLILRTIFELKLIVFYFLSLSLFLRSGAKSLLRATLLLLMKISRCVTTAFKMKSTTPSKIPPC